MTIKMKFLGSAGAVFLLCLLLRSAAAATAGRTGGGERARRFAVSVPWLIDCADSVDCVFKITEFATYR